MHLLQLIHLLGRFLANIQPSKGYKHLLEGQKGEKGNICSATLSLTDSLLVIRANESRIHRLFCCFYRFYNSTNELVGVGALNAAPTSTPLLGRIGSYNFPRSDGSIKGARRGL